MPLEIETTEIAGAVLITPRLFADHRGFFSEIYKKSDYVDAGIDADFKQDNHSRSSFGVVRGLHYQLKKPQAKLISVARGEIFDIALDIRQSSPTFGKWIGAILSAENRQQLFIPGGFAHGFIVLSEYADVIYKCDDYYNPGDDYGVLWNDPDLEIDWPEMEAILSEKDAVLPRLRDVPPEKLPE